MALSEEKLYEILRKAPDENDHWDFKREWYHKEKKLNLVIDIMNLVNTPHYDDCYIIIGVDDNTGAIVGIDESDPNRLNRQKLQSYIRAKPFAQNWYPLTDVNTYKVVSNLKKRKIVTIDVITIFNQNKLPIFLSCDMRRSNKVVIRGGTIYSRTLDSNSSVDSSNSDDKIEKLWKKRFGLDRSIFDKFKIKMKDKEHWTHIKRIDVQPERYIYELNPDYMIEISREEKLGELVEETSYSQLRSRIAWCKYRLIFKNTIIYENIGNYLNDYRMLIAQPKLQNFNFCHQDFIYHIYYLCKDTLEFVFTDLISSLQHFSIDNPQDFTDINFKKDVLIFRDDKERIRLVRDAHNLISRHPEYLTVQPSEIAQLQKRIDLSLHEDEKNKGKYMDVLQICKDHKICKVIKRIQDRYCMNGL